MKQLRVLLPSLLAVLASTLPLDPLAAQGNRRFGERTEVVVVEVPVQVLQDGRPVRGLTADDFEIVDGKQKQQLVGFEVLDLSVTSSGASAGEAAVAADLPISARRHFLLLFDLSFSDVSSVSRAREAAEDLVLEGLHPSDVVGVATYSESRGVQLVLGFTSDRRQVQLALETLGLIDPAERARDPLGLVLASPGAPASGASSSGRLDREALFQETLRDLSNLSGRTARDAARNQILAMSSSLTELAALMSRVDGRKHVVLLSEGFDSSILLGTEGSSEEEQNAIEATNEAAASGRFWEVDSEARFGSTSSQSVLSRMLEEFVRADCTIQSVDIGGLRAAGDAADGAVGQTGARSRGENGLFIMANETGGELIRNFNDLSDAMNEVLERTSVTYVLAFQPTDLAFDGSFHRLKVRLTKGDKGLRLVHRPGYYAPRPYSEQSPIERRLASAEMILGGGGGGAIGTSLLAAPFLVPGERAYVPVLVEIEGEGLLAGSSGDVLPAEIYGYALGSDGSIQDFFNQALGLDVAKYGGALQQTGFKFWGHFDLGPGDYTVRVLVRNATTGASGLAVAPLRVPSAQEAEAALLPPLFPEPAGKWLLGREGQEEQRDVPYPFMLAGQPFIPAAKPVVAPGAEAQVCLIGYHLGDGSMTVEGRLFKGDGTPLEAGELAVAGGATAEGDGRHQLMATFRSGSLAAGEYTLVVTVTDPVSGASQSSSIPVVIGG